MKDEPILCRCGAPARRKYCSDRCAKAAFRARDPSRQAAYSRAWREKNPDAVRAITKRYLQSPKGKATGLRAKKRRSHATKGRVCVGCKRTDAETLWSHVVACCSACHRAGLRNGWASCGAPLWHGGHHLPIRCRAHGVRSEAAPGRPCSEL